MSGNKLGRTLGLIYVQHARVAELYGALEQCRGNWPSPRRLIKKESKTAKNQQKMPQAERVIPFYTGI